MLGFILGGLGMLLLGGLIQDDDKRHRYRSNRYNYKYERSLKEEALNLFNQRKYEFITSFSHKTAYEFINNTGFCFQEIKNDYNKYKLELSNYMDKILEIENKENIFDYFLNQTLNNLSKKMSKLKVKHLNILLVGPSGVGKSFLINSILKLNGKKKAETKICKPTTKTFNIYESNKFPNIRLIDSRGIEKGNYNADELVKSIKDYIENKELSGNPDNFIHCIWYCITGTRFEDIEEETLRKISSIYDDSKLPIIVVYTQAIIPNYYNAIKEEIKKIKNEIEFIPIVAQDIKLSHNSIIKSKNIDLLLNKSLEKSKNAVFSSVFSSIRKIVKNEADNQIIKDTKKIKNYLNQYIPIKTTNISSMIEFDEEKIYNKIFNILLLKDESELKEESKKMLTEFIVYIKTKNKEITQKCLKDFSNQKSYEISYKLLEIQSQVDDEKDGYLMEYKNRQQLEEETSSYIKNEINQYAEKFGYLNYIRILPLKIVDLLSEKVKNEFDLILVNNSTKNMLNEKIQNQFHEIKFLEKREYYGIEIILIILIAIKFTFKK